MSLLGLNAGALTAKVAGTMPCTFECASRCGYAHYAAQTSHFIHVVVVAVLQSTAAIVKLFSPFRLSSLQQVAVEVYNDGMQGCRDFTVPIMYLVGALCITPVDMHHVRVTWVTRTGQLSPPSATGS